MKYSVKDLGINLSTGFHIYSYEGGTCKTLAAIIGATVMGNSDYIVHQWRQTANNLDLVCARSSDGLLVLDEIKQLKKSCLLSEIIMQMGNNEGAGRMAQDTQSSRESFTWLMYYLSTGNQPTDQIIREREGNDLLGAEETRLYNIEMILPTNYHNKTDKKQLAKELYSAVNKYYGIAGHEFISRYLKIYVSNKNEALRIYNQVEKQLHELIEAHKSEFAGYEIHGRIITAFSVVATAGRMAKFLKILPDEFDPIETVWIILSNYLKNRGGNVDQKTYLRKLYHYTVTERSNYFTDNTNENNVSSPKRENWGHVTKDNNKEYAEIVTTNFAKMYGLNDYRGTRNIRNFLKTKGVIIGDTYQKSSGKRYVKIDIEVLSKLVT
ncbi:MAG: putative primase/helicase [Pseudomonadota bacterium]|nr:putative primase/helicase [Pseudomonadota bacterium]